MTLSRARRPSRRPLPWALALTTWGCTSYSYDWVAQDAGIAAGTGGSESSGGAPAGGAGGSGGGGLGGSPASPDAGSAGSGGGDAPAYMKVTPKLNDGLATPAARRLMHFLTDSYGHTILSGQQGLEYAETVLAITGREPAVLGLDLIDYSPSRVAHGASSNAAEQAIAWWQRGGIVTFAWHWNAPSHLIDEPGQEWWRGFYTAATTFDIAEAINPASAEYEELLNDIDAIAVPLKQLADADVPVLFRPLHEASGGWFWWGARGTVPYLGLWGLLHDRLTLVHGLHNLIWVWNGQSPSWYPGDAMVDIVSEDIYAQERVYSPELQKFLDATTYSTQPKLVALSETGALPDPDSLVATGAAWSWFCGWSGPEYITDETWNEDAMKRAVYAHEYVTTLDELPDLTSYPLPDAAP